MACPSTLSNCSNNYGPYQFPEKLIPLMILNMLEGKSLPVYGDGKNIRDWIYVEDHNSAVWEIMERGETGRSYNIGGENEWENLRLLKPPHRDRRRGIGRGQAKLPFADYLREGPAGPRSPIRHRLLADQEGAGLEAGFELRRGPAENGALVP